MDAVSLFEIWDIRFRTANTYSPFHAFRTFTTEENLFLMFLMYFYLHIENFIYL